MPWRSEQQRKWGHTEAGKEALGGEAAVHEWDEATRGKKLPHKVAKMEMPAKVGIPSVKMPKAKSMPGAFDKPSKFFKSEDFASIKHPSVRKLWDFMQKKHKASQS